jgi:1,4-dihydroxy-2-naphthoate octaprenyltransferase
MADGGLILGSLCALERPWAALILGGGITAGPAVRSVLRGAGGSDLVPVLGRTASTQMLAGALLALGLALSV